MTSSTEERMSKATGVLRTGRHSVPSVGLGFALVGAAASVYVAYTPAARPGLELQWLIPMAFTVCAVAFWPIVKYHKGGVGLKVLYILILLRYLVSPVLISATSGRVTALMVPASESGYQFSVFVTVVELVVCCLTIAISWPKAAARMAARKSEGRTVGRERALTLGGAVAVAFLCFVILTRGFEGVQSSFGFLVITKRYEEAVVDSYAVTAIQVLKSFLFVCVAIWCRQNYQRSGGVRWFLLAGLAAFLNITTYFGYNRSLILQTAIATIVCLIFAFPRMRQVATLALVPVAAAILYGLATLKQFGVGADRSGDLASTLSLDQISQNLENYVGGAWPLAIGHDAASALADQVSAMTMVRTYTDNFFLFKIPGFDWINGIFYGAPSVIDLYQRYTWPAQGAMLPTSGEMWFYGGDLFGMLLVVVANIVVFRVLVEVDLRAAVSEGLQAKFVLTWLSVLFGLAMGYTLITIIWSFSKFALFLAILFWINNRGLLTKTKTGKVS